MAKIISLQNFQEKNKEKDLKEILTESAKNFRFFKERSKKGILVFTDLKRFFEMTINQELFNLREISSENFICSKYVSTLLVNFSPKDWKKEYLVDYFEEMSRNKGEPFLLQEGADFCFMVYSLFPRNKERFFTGLKFYFKSGITLYYLYYRETGKEIGYFMGKQFRLMAEIVSKKFKEPS